MDFTATKHGSPPAIRSLLRRIGLDEREADVYLALLAMKIGRASRIAKSAQQSRSHTYLLLRSLEAKGLVAEVERGSVLHFVAEPPERLMSYLKDRAQEIQTLEGLTQGALPSLSSLTHPLRGEPRVTVLHGLEGIRQIYRDVLTRRFVAFFNPEIGYKAFGGNIVHMLFGEDAKLHGKDLLVNNRAAQRYIREVPPHAEYEIRILPRGITFDADIIVFEEEVSIFTFSDEPTVIRMENRDFAEALRAWFVVLWEMSACLESKEA